MRASRLLIVLAVLLTAVVGCAGDDGGAPAADESPAPTENLSEKPIVEAPQGDPPAELEIEDLVEGEGDEATAGADVRVHYVGVAWASGDEFDASWDRGEPFEFSLGAGDVIAGWDAGVEGMRVGGRRRLVVPPEQAYGEAGAGGVIGPNETLVFVIDLLAVE